MKNYDVDISKLSNVFATKVSTYKYYWMLALLDIIDQEESSSCIDFSDMVAHMIGKAWYLVINGTFKSSSFDFLSERITQLIDNTEITVDDIDNKVCEYIIANKDSKAVKKIINQLTGCVPYRFLYPWIGANTNRQTELLSQDFDKYNCPYAIFGKSIKLNPKWIQYLKDHRFLYENSTRYQLSQYLSKFKPDVSPEKSILSAFERTALVVCESEPSKHSKCNYSIETGDIQSTLRLLLSVLHPNSFIINQTFNSSTKVINSDHVEIDNHNFYSGSRNTENRLSCNAPFYNQEGTVFGNVNNKKGKQNGKRKNSSQS